MAIKIIVEDRKGLLHDISNILATGNVNIEDIASYEIGGKVIIRLETSNDERASELLTDNGYPLTREEVLMIKLKNRPGELAKVTKILKDKDINILSAHMVDKTREEVVLALSVDKPEEAKIILEENSYLLPLRR